MPATAHTWGDRPGNYGFTGRVIGASVDIVDLEGEKGEIELNAITSFEIGILTIVGGVDIVVVSAGVFDRSTDCCASRDASNWRGVVRVARRTAVPGGSLPATVFVAEDGLKDDGSIGGLETEPNVNDFTIIASWGTVGHAVSTFHGTDGGVGRTKPELWVAVGFELLFLAEGQSVVHVLGARNDGLSGVGAFFVRVRAVVWVDHGDAVVHFVVQDLTARRHLMDAARLSPAVRSQYISSLFVDDGSKSMALEHQSS